MKFKITLLLLLFSGIAFAQETKKEKEDLDYEIHHKSQPWFSNMKDGANYFNIKKQYDTFFGKHQWEKSKPRSLGESWLKTRLFYLDKKGNVQPEPTLETNSYNSPLNTVNTTSTNLIGTWTLLGPVNSAETGYSGRGNHGGYVFLNRIDPTNSQKMFVSFVTGGLWMTVDGGTNWTLVDSNLPDAAYNDLDVAISNPQIVYAISNQQVVKSIDGGLNWLPTTMVSSSYSGKFYDIAVSTSNPNTVIARIGDKIYRTTDGGITWNSVITGLRNHQTWDSSEHSEMIEWSANSTNVVYSVSTNHNNQVLLHRSNNSGASFSLASTLTLASNATGQSVGWAKIFTPTSDTNSIYVAVGSGANAYGHQAVHLYKLNATTGAQENVRTNMIPGTGKNTQHHGDVTMDRNNHNKIVYGTYSQKIIHISTDNGVTFTDSATETHSDIRSIDVVSNKILVGSDGESALTTNDGNTMPTVTNSISNHELWGFGSAFKTDIVASGNNHGPVMIKESGNGFDWYNGTGADQGNTDVNPLDDRYIYSQGYSNYRYFRTGVHTLENQSNFLDVGGIYSYFNNIEFHPNNYYTIITHHAGTYPQNNPNLGVWKNSLIKTEDNGNTISIVKTFNDQVFREKISMKNPDHMYVVVGLTNNKLWYTADAGITWKDVTPTSTESSGQTNISDIAVGDENPNEVWITYSGVQNACKVLKSIDYGATYTNITQSNLTTFPLTKIVFQRGSNGGVYVGGKGGIYYRNNTMQNWELLGNGLPMADIRNMFINYNQGKLKIGTSRGAFTHDLYETSPVNALISASTSKVNCPAIEMVQFKDYSVVRNASATWSWSFPGGTPSTSTLENPEVSYKNAADGTYSVTLTVTDATGTSSQTLTNFIEVASQCGDATPEKVPGNVAKLSGATNSDHLLIDNLNVNKNSFTFSAWIKPNGIQEDYSGIFMTQSGSPFGLNFVSGNNTIGYHPIWYWSSGLIAPADEWSHVALVSNGTDVKIYVNGEESIRETAISSEVFSKINLGRYGNGYSSRYTNMEIDEVSIWNRPLSKDEIREWRHLTKSDTSNPIRTGLVAYYQFNEATGNISVNKTENSNPLTYLGSTASSHTNSSAPVFSGVSEKVNINSAGLKDFSTTGVSMTFANGQLPNGDVWVSKSTINPIGLPDNLQDFKSYYIINNYGQNKNFTPITNMSFTDNENFTNTVASDYNLYKRESNTFGGWGTVLDTGDAISGSDGTNIKISFTTGLDVHSFSQFTLSNNVVTPLSVSKIKDKSKPEIYPNPSTKKDGVSINIPINWEASTLIVYNLLGQKMSQATLQPGENLLKINTKVGIYNLVIYNSNHKFTEKLILN
ncbi:T9SS type A sorting domain-containing protein [Polaribacter haliotis]|uniref:T9SS type A sorting domain-containing protein n=1 Tax=Polaribacter haliotis TaxID=1888915 RepID=A0A7L8AFM3_9FLAO|nr:LamG-like jellyroll fold domain-containing protein [Polaribacter haliotis]QOD60813.1 T9SS type A sorting domain-containing protein [Polaribacter haliotis]